MSSTIQLSSYDAFPDSVLGVMKSLQKDVRSVASVKKEFSNQFLLRSTLSSERFHTNTTRLINQLFQRFKEDVLNDLSLGKVSINGNVQSLRNQYPEQDELLQL